MCALTTPSARVLPRALSPPISSALIPAPSCALSAAPWYAASPADPRCLPRRLVGLVPSARDRKEFHRMGAEKFAAFNEGGQCIVSPASESSQGYGEIGKCSSIALRPCW